MKKFLLCSTIALFGFSAMQNVEARAPTQTTVAQATSSTTTTGTAPDYSNIDFTQPLPAATANAARQYYLKQSSTTKNKILSMTAITSDVTGISDYEFEEAVTQMTKGVASSAQTIKKLSGDNGKLSFNNKESKERAKALLVASKGDPTSLIALLKSQFQTWSKKESKGTFCSGRIKFGDPDECICWRTAAHRARQTGKIQAANAVEGLFKCATGLNMPNANGAL